LHAVVRWSDHGASADVDVAALLLGSDGRVRSDEDFVFYNAPVAAEGAVRLLGKRAQERTSEDRVAVDLEALPANVSRVVISASLDATSGLGFGDMEHLALDLLDAAGVSCVQFHVADAGPETAMVLGELYLRGEEWKFRAVGQGWDTGLAGLAVDYGIVVDEPDDASGHDSDSTGGFGPETVPPGGFQPTSEQVEAAASAEDDLVDALDNREELVDLPPSVDVDETTAVSETGSRALAAVSACPRPGGLGGGVEAHDRHIHALQGGLFVREGPARPARRVDQLRPWPSRANASAQILDRVVLEICPPYLLDRVAEVEPYVLDDRYALDPGRVLGVVQRVDRSPRPRGV